MQPSRSNFREKPSIGQLLWRQRKFVLFIINAAQPSSHSQTLAPFFYRLSASSRNTRPDVIQLAQSSKSSAFRKYPCGNAILVKLFLLLFTPVLHSVDILQWVFNVILIATIEESVARNVAKLSLISQRNGAFTHYRLSEDLSGFVEFSPFALLCMIR